MEPGPGSEWDLLAVVQPELGLELEGLLAEARGLQFVRVTGSARIAAPWCVCVCVCERERERERESVSVCVCVCVCV